MSGMTAAEMMTAAMNGNLDLDAGGDGEGSEQQSDNKEAAAEPKKEDAAAAPAAPAQGDKPEGQKQPDAVEEVPGTPIASKSGTYQIPFERLAEARQRAATLEAENAQLRAQNADLTTKQQANLAQQQAEAQQRAANGEQQTQADKNLDAAGKALKAGEDISIFGDFSEEGLAAGIEKLLNKRLEERLAPLRQEIAPLKETAVQTAEREHYSAIISVHPDAVELMDSSEFANWKAGLPAFMRQGVADALDKGAPQDVIDVFDSFKKAAGKAPAAAAAPAAQGTAGKTPEVQAHVPHSLSEIAGQNADDPSAVVMSKTGNPAALMGHFAGLSKQQIEDALDRVV